MWERMIKSVRRILNSLMENTSGCLNDESFSTFLCEVESILNSRPLTVVSQDPAGGLQLSPEKILTQKTGGAASMPGVFPRDDLYAKNSGARYNI